MIRQKMADFRRIGHLTLVCIPASTVEAHNARYLHFSNQLCTALGMDNAFNHIHFLREKTPKHLGGTGEAMFSLDNAWFRGRLVVLFDDIVSSGRSTKAFIQRLEGSGARVVLILALGKSWNHLAHGKVNHPWLTDPARVA